MSPAKPLLGPSASGRSCRICGCTDSRACPEGCYWVDVSSERGPVCSECAYMILLVDAGLVVDDDDHQYTISEVADQFGIVGIEEIAAQLAGSGVVIPRAGARGAS